MNSFFTQRDLYAWLLNTPCLFYLSRYIFALYLIENNMNTSLNQRYHAVLILDVHLLFQNNLRYFNYFTIKKYF